MSEQMRENFELHMYRQNICTRLSRHPSDDTYKTISVQRAWELWQAALATQGGVTDLVTRESAEQAIDHMSKYNGHGRDADARDMLVSTTQPQAPQGGDIMEKIASQWDGCMCDIAAVGEVDIGAAIRDDWKNYSQLAPTETPEAGK